MLSLGCCMCAIQTSPEKGYHHQNVEKMCYRSCGSDANPGLPTTLSKEEDHLAEYVVDMVHQNLKGKVVIISYTEREMGI